MADDSRMQVMTWNVRSLSNVTNRHALELLLHLQKPTVVVLTETWASKPIKVSAQYTVHQSPPARSQGVAVLVRADVASSPYRKRD